MSARKRLTLVGSAALVVALLAFSAWRLLPTPPPPQLTLLNGERVSFAALRGRTVLLVFWATTCAPCVQEAPDLAALYTQLHARGFELIAVAMQYDPPARVLAFRDSQKLPYRVALDLDGTVARHFKVQAIPRALLLDANGDIVFDRLGKLDVDALRTQLEKLLRTA